MSIQNLVDLIDKLHEQDAYHIKRGFPLSEATPLIASNHLLEEAMEIQAEIIDGSGKDLITEEAGDLLAVFCHLLKMSGISLDEVAGAAMSKLNTVYTTNPDEVTATISVVTRRGRAQE